MAPWQVLIVGLLVSVPYLMFASTLHTTRGEADRRPPRGGKFSTADCVLFVDDSSAQSNPALADLATTHRVTVERYTQQNLEPSFLRKYHASSFRWPLISEYLARVADHGYRGVLMADVRDTAFQAEPFDTILGARSRVFFAFNGVESRTIGECGWNGGWIRDCFGEKKRVALAKKPIVCSGVSIATFAEAAAYAAQMGTVLGDAAFAQCERNGVDQGVHNVLVHEDRVAGLELVGQRSALVANLQARVATIEGNALVRNPEGALVSVVHQYDRFPDLAAFYYATYAAAVSNKKPGGACAAYTTRRDFDLYKAKCDLKAAGGNSAEDCCEACSAADGCRGWTHAGTLCYLKSCREPVTNVVMRGATSGYLPQ